MTLLLILLSLLIQFAVLWAVFYFKLNQTIGSLVSVAVAVICAVFITPWSLLVGIPIILMSIVILIPALREALISRPAFNLLSNAMPSMSTTEREALEAGTSWWEKELFMGEPDWEKFDQYPYPKLSTEEQSFW